ncbi:MAG: molybdopterin-guanine dinucleotide biosynthesis protein B [Beijerinckiaceae bacterium]
MRVIGVTGWSGSGKTTLLLKVIPLLRARGVRVATVKHAHHDFDVDQPGKDSYEHRKAGANEVLVASARRFALMHELRDEAEWTLAALLQKLSPVDLVIVEGFKTQRHAKIEVWREATRQPPICIHDPTILSVATCDMCPVRGIPMMNLNDPALIADVMMMLAVPLDETLARLAAPGVGAAPHQGDWV